MSSVMSASPGAQLCPRLGETLVVREQGTLPGKALLCLLGAPSWTVESVWFMVPGSACCLELCLPWTQ